MHHRTPPAQPGSKHSTYRRRRPATLLLAGLLAVSGLALSASAAFGGFSTLVGAVRDHVYCHVVHSGVCADPPETHIVSGPAGVTSDPTPTFHFSSSVDRVRYRCRIDGRPWHTCQNPYTTFRLKDGDHSLRVAALNRDGTPDPTPAERDFNVAADGHGNSHGHDHGGANHGHGHGHSGDSSNGHGHHGSNHGHGSSTHGHGHAHTGSHGHGHSNHSGHGHGHSR
jgi:hypothetical protein